MSRSRKKHPFFAPCKGPDDSDKRDKQETHRLFRKRERVLLAKSEYEILPFRHDEVRTEWNFASDGPKIYESNPAAWMMRK